MEYTPGLKTSLFYGGFSICNWGAFLKAARTVGSRFYSATPAFQIFPAFQLWSFIGGGIFIFRKTPYILKPRSGFRIAALRYIATRCLCKDIKQ